MINYFQIKSRTNMKNLFLFIAIVFIFTQNIFAQESSFLQNVKTCYEQDSFKDFMYRIKQEHNCFLGQEIPDFTKKDIKDNLIRKKDIIGKVTVINFWFTACPPCLDELPDLNKLASEFSEGQCVFIAPSTDDKKMINEYLKNYEFNYIIIPDANSWFREELGSFSGFPTTMVLDKKGIIRGYFGEGLTIQSIKKDGKFDIYLSLKKLITDLLKE